MILLMKYLPLLVIVLLGCTKSKPVQAPTVAGSSAKPDFVIPTMTIAPQKCVVAQTMPNDDGCMLYKFKCESGSVVMAEICTMTAVEAPKPEPERLFPFDFGR